MYLNPNKAIVMPFLTCIVWSYEKTHVLKFELNLM